MLPSHLETCPRCQVNLKTGELPGTGFSLKDILQVSGVVILVAIIPLCLVIVTAVVCVNSLQ
jgi:hypothetical protein